MKINEEMKNKLILFGLIALAPFTLNAQKIDISLPKQANKEYAFILNRGIKQDTIQKGNVSFTGGITINIPQKNKDYVGMASLQIKDNPPVNMIINHENFDLEQNPDSKYVFKNSAENTYLYSILQDGVVPPVDSTLYAAHFINLIRYMQQLNKVNSQNVSLAERSNVRLYALDKLDMNRLYTSSLWYFIIDGLVKLTTNQEVLGNDMVRLLKRVKSQEIFEHLAKNLITITEQYGMDDAFDIIVPYIQESGRIKVPQGNMFTAFALAKVRKGTLAPPIEGLKRSVKETGSKKTLLAFYQPDCENCHVQMDRLIKDYPKLKQMGVRVISISSDTDKNSFEKDIKRFPWADEDKLCDLKGFAGKNFLNYGIMSTPTFFLLDENNKVIKRYAIIADIDFSAGINEKK